MASTQLLFDILARDHASAVFNKVGAAADKLGKQTDKAGKSHGAFGKAVRWAGGMVSAYGIGMFVKSSVQEYAAAEAAQNKLANSYKRFPAMQNVALQAFKDMNTQLQLHTRFDDDDTAAMQANLARFDLTGKQVMKLTPLVADLAQVQGTDMVTAGGNLGKAMLGNTRALKALGISYTATGDRAKDMRNVIDLVNKKVGGEAAKASDTAAVKLAIFGNQWGELKETIGTAALPGLTKLVDVGGPAITELGDMVRRNMPQIEQTFEDAWGAAEKFGGVIKGVWDTFASLPPGVRETLLLLGGATVAVGKIKGSALGSGIGAVFSGLKSITAGHVTVNGGKVNCGGGQGRQDRRPAAPPPGRPGVVAASLLNPLTIASVVAAAATIWNLRQHRNDPRAPVPVPAPGPVTVPGNAGRPVVSKGNRDRDWIDSGKQDRANVASTARYAAQWKLVTVSIKDASGAYTQFAFQSKNKKWVDEKQPRAIDAAAARYKALAKAVKDVPNKKSTKVDAPGAKESKGRVKGLDGAVRGLKGKSVKVAENGADPSRGRVNTLKGAIGGLQGKQVRVGVSGADNARTQVYQLVTAINSLHDKTVTTYYREVKAGQVKNAAGGGYISGPGTGTSDDIPARLSNGEYVIRASAVRRYGRAFLDAVNTGSLTGFKDGTPPTKKDADKAKRAEEVAKQIAAAKREARRQQRLARFIQTEDLSDPAADWLTSQDPAVQRRFMKRPNQIGRFARMAGAVQDRRAERDAQRSRDQAMAARGLAAMDPVARKNTLAERVAQTNKELANTKGPAARARLLAKLQEQEDQLAQATQDVTDAERAQQEQREAAQDAALEKVNALRDAVDSASGSYRSFASIATTSVTDVADAQQKLSDSNDAVAAAQKKIDLAGSDRERAAAAAELAKALKEQQSAQQGVAAAGKPTSAGIRLNMAQRLAKLKGFGDFVRTLKAQGLNPVTLSELMQMGPEQGYDYAKALLDGGLGDINAIQNQITQESASLGYAQYSTDAAAASMTGFAAAQAAGLTSGGLVIAPAPVTLTLDGATIASALVAFARQNGGSIPGLTPG